MYELQAPSRRLLQETALILASSPASANNSDNNQSDNNAFNVNGTFSPSMAIILVILLSAFFFMAFFSIYVKRCSSSQQADAPRRTTQPSASAQPGSQGVDATFLETLPLIAYSSAKKKGSNVECVVCLADFEEGEPLCQLPRCKHVFHKDCINMWLFSHTSCPLCRRSVISDGTRSFRWGGSSGSLRLSLGTRGSWHRGGRGSAGGPFTPNGGQETLPELTSSADRRRTVRFPRSHSTGHSMAKRWQSTALMSGVRGVDGDSDEVRPTAGCLPLTPVAPFQRSRSVAALGDGSFPPIRIGGWVREAGASLKRVLSVKKLGSVGASSSSAATFNRMSPV